MEDVSESIESIQTVPKPHEKSLTTPKTSLKAEEPQTEHSCAKLLTSTLSHIAVVLPDGEH